MRQCLGEKKSLTSFPQMSDIGHESALGQDAEPSGLGRQRCRRQTGSPNSYAHAVHLKYLTYLLNCSIFPP